MPHKKLWLASPNDFNNGNANVSNVNSDGNLNANNADNSNGVRPSFSLTILAKLLAKYC
ncbi:MAG: DUF6273 domain-containing protein [Bacilli bacterium]